MAFATADKNPSQWQARLKLGFTQRGTRTVLSERSHHGPLMVQKPFYPGDGACHVYILHPPGGLVGGDQLHLMADVGAKARVLLTTPAASKLYRSPGLSAGVQQDFQVATGASLEYLPQETILYNGSHCQLHTRISLAAGATFMGWEMLCLGRPAAQEIFASGQCQQSFELWREGHPLLIERAHWIGGSAVLQAPWGLAGYGVTATLLATPVNEALLTAIRASWVAPATTVMSLSVLGDVLVVRLLGYQAREALAGLQSVWQLLRPALLAMPALPPRIWAT